MSETKYNHYVPRFYLKEFLNDEAFFYQYDKQKKEYHKKYKENFKSICSKKNLYSLKESNKITEVDYEFIKRKFKIDMKNDLRELFIKVLGSFINDDFSTLNKILNAMDEKSYEDYINKIKQIISSSDNKISRSQEDLFTSYENRFIPVYNKIIKNRSINFLKYKSSEGDIPLGYILVKIIYFICGSSDKESTTYDEIIEHYDFVHYIFVQYFRTDKRISQLISNIKEYKNKSLGKELNSINGITFILLHFFALNSCDSCILRGYQIVLLDNQTSIDFITSDVGCVNTYYDEVNQKKLDEDELEIYFPLSNRLAILYTKNLAESNYMLNKNKKIDYYNGLLLKNADRYLYGSKEAIKRIVK